MSDPSMVVELIDYDNHLAIVKLKQYTSRFIISKAKSAILYSLRFESSSSNLPKELAGKYTSIDKAIQCLHDFSLVAKETFATKSERLDKERKERHAAAAKSGNGK